MHLRIILGVSTYFIFVDTPKIIIIIILVSKYLAWVLILTSDSHTYTIDIFIVLELSKTNEKTTSSSWRCRVFVQQKQNKLYAFCVVFIVKINTEIYLRGWNCLKWWNQFKFGNVLPKGIWREANRTTSRRPQLLFYFLRKLWKNPFIHFGLQG